MAGLDRRFFTVVVICISNADAYLSPDVIRAADEVHHIPLLKAEGDRVGTR